MTREKAKEMLPIITAHAAGQRIQYNIGFGWRDIFDINLDYDVEQFRIKPELEPEPELEPPTYRPWTPEEVPVGQFKVKSATCWDLGLQVTFSELIMWDSNHQKMVAQTFEYLANNYIHSTDNGKTWHPCGVLVK